MNLNLKNKNCELTITLDCENELLSDIHPDNLKKIDPRNSKNPMDEIGEFHNYAMKRIFMIPNETEYKEDQVIEQLNSLIQKYPFKSETLANIAKSDTKETLNKIGDKLYQVLQFNWLYPPTPEQKEILPDFLGDLIVWIGKTISNFDKTQDSLIKQKEQIIAYEDVILNSKIEQNTKESALVALSIMRHSSILYIEHFNGGTGGSGVSGKKKCNCKAVARVAIADAVGAATGFLSGSGIGAVVGGVVGSGKQLMTELK